MLTRCNTSKHKSLRHRPVLAHCLQAGNNLCMAADAVTLEIAGTQDPCLRCRSDNKERNEHNIIVKIGKDMRLMLFDEILLPNTHPKMFQDRAFTNTGWNCCSWRRELEDQGQVEPWLESLHYTGGGAAKLSCFKVGHQPTAAAAALSQLLLPPHFPNGALLLRSIVEEPLLQLLCCSCLVAAAAGATLPQRSSPVKVDHRGAAAAAALSQLPCRSCLVAAAWLQQLLVPHFPNEALL